MTTIFFLFFEDAFARRQDGIKRRHPEYKASECFGINFQNAVNGKGPVGGDRSLGADAGARRRGIISTCTRRRSTPGYILYDPFTLVLV